MTKPPKDNAIELVLKFKAILESTASIVITDKGPPIKAFTHQDSAGERIIRHPASRRAYAKRLRDFKYLIGIVKELPLDDLSAITNSLGGSFRLPLHLFLHYCLPKYEGKERMLEQHRKFNAADKTMNNILGEVEEWLDQGKISDQAYAARLLDDNILIEFASHWIQTTSFRG
jgi:hypothetical protein